MRVEIIDIDSNTTRLLIFEIHKKMHIVLGQLRMSLMEYQQPLKSYELRKQSGFNKQIKGRLANEICISTEMMNRGIFI